MILELKEFLSKHKTLSYVICGFIVLYSYLQQPRQFDYSNRGRQNMPNYQRNYSNPYQGNSNYTNYSGGQGNAYSGGYSNSGYNSSDDQMNAWTKNQNTQSEMASSFDDYILGQEKVVTQDGSVYNVESGYNQTFINTNTNEGVQTLDASATGTQYGGGYESTTPYNYGTTTTSSGDGGNE